MKSLVLSIILYCAFISSHAQCLKLDLVILADVSGSVEGHEYFINNAIREFTKKFNKTDVNIGLVTFSDDARVEFHLGDTIKYRINTGGTTDLIDAVDMGVYELFGEYSRDGYRKMLLIISDGSPNDINGSKLRVQQAKTMGIGVAGVLINATDSHSDYMEEICDVYVETQFELLSEELLKLNLCL